MHVTNERSHAVDQYAHIANERSHARDSTVYQKAISKRGSKPADLLGIAAAIPTALEMAFGSSIAQSGLVGMQLKRID